MDELRSLYEIPASGDTSSKYEKIQANLAKLSVLLDSTPDLLSSEELQTYLATILHPPQELLPEEQYFREDDDESKDEPTSDQTAWHPFHRVSEKALTLLHSSLSHTPSPSAVNPTIAMAVVTYTNPTDPWTTPTSQQLSTTLQSSNQDLTSPQTLLAILKTTIKPLFKSSLTPAGRAPRRESTNKGAALQTPTWPKELPQAMTLLSHITTHLSTDSLESAWPLLIPPLLSIHDSTNPEHKTAASNLLLALLPKLPDGLLARTGLAPVLRDALVPDLLLLPPLTPTRYSIPLLQATYAVLRTLTRISTSDTRHRAEQLDVIFRSGIIRGFTFAGENARVAEELMRQISALVIDMGVYAVRHLGDLVQVFGTVLGDPFVGLARGLLTATLDTVEVVLGVCWVRICGYVPGVLKAVASCYATVYGEGEGKGGTEVVDRLKKIVSILRAVMAAEKREAEILELEKNIAQADGRLAGLFDSG
ncbi:hypothetical protein L873DRAFT_1836106 [Choiromyces venosus 120613-1]|uniref:Uncharacterized protein n=1 Tax=Choiromyces venosus 120613-1 TaxID=1336337 RepID=A0A3N4JII7_9PEZI|nr:hypothetical protein L873DRAFT_1836106 [Choiromyces venosus 120613-1]